MRLSNIISSVAVSGILLASASPSFAQTVGTSNHVRTEVGTLNTKTNLQIHQSGEYSSVGEAIANTNTFKLEAYGPNAISTISFDGDEVKGLAIASTAVETDPVVILVTSEAQSKFSETETKSSKTEGTVQERGSFFVNDLTIDANAYLK